MNEVTILDGYVDEPTCLGVPPYISPYPRYIAGAIRSAKRDIKINYITIDQVREGEREVLEKANLVVVVAGMIVPGKYLSGFPASPRELREFLCGLDNKKVLCGPAARYGFGLSGGKGVRDAEELMDVFDLIIKGDPEVVLKDLAERNFSIDRVDPTKLRESSGEIRDFAIRGACIVRQHPNFPHYLIAEIETYRGCPRAITGGCSFCSEPLKGLPDFRPVRDIVDEVRALYMQGVRNFRIGNQPCIFSYMAKGCGEEEFPEPNPQAIERLFRGIRFVAPRLKTLHIDNANPGVIARHPEKSREVAKVIIKYHTPGDVAAFGVESADPVVIRENNLKAEPDQVMEAIRILNEVGSRIGANGLPELLPGINFVFGLKGESKRTFELDFAFLKKIVDSKLLIRRINLRQVIPIPGTRMYEVGTKITKKHKEIFKRFKRKVREEIDRVMLSRLVPIGRVLKDVYTEIHRGKLTFARQIGSYPILIGIPGRLQLGKFIDVKVVGCGYRSITAVPYPLDVNSAEKETLEAIPLIGKRRALRIMLNRPFKDERDFIKIFDDFRIAKKVLDFGLVFGRKDSAERI